MPIGDRFDFTESGIWRIKLLAADNAVNDSNLLQIYRVETVNGSGSYLYGDGEGGQPTYAPFIAGNGTKTLTSKHYMRYRIGNGTLFKVDLNIDHVKTETWDYIIDVLSGWYANAGNHVITNTGEYIFESSCQINMGGTGVMVATYLIYGYNEDTPRREIKVIDMATGMITDLDNGDMQVEEILWTNPAAIGLHIREV